MTYNVMAINPGHNGSAALVVDGKLELYIEEERFSRSKYDGNPFKAMIFIMDRYHINEFVIGGTGQENHSLPWTGEDSYSALVRKYYPKAKIHKFGHEHHLGHATAAFFGSGFESAAAVIVDGCGSLKDIEFGDQKIPYYETETIMKCSKPNDFEVVFKRFANNYGPRASDFEREVDSTVTTVKAYEGVSMYLGFGFIEAGKTMGLAPYGKKDKNIPDLFLKGTNRGDKNVFMPNYPAGSFIDTERYEYLKQTEDPRSWHRDPSKLTEAAKNLAYKVQKETETFIGDLIEKAVDMTGEKNIVISGGYGLNCVANYYYKERFPELNIYVDPISHDGGTTIGLAKLICNNYLLQNEKEPPHDPVTSLYLGPEYDLSDLYIEWDYKDAEVSKVTPKEIAELINDKNIVCMYQGRSEAGPRALGNRSILYNPADPNGKDFVNTVKNREWFRPFAGTIMKEHVHEWFDLRGMDETPFMMYAVELQSEKIGELPAITHVDGTCRIQTVSKEQNENYYNLINEFYKLTDVPVLFNTSFNLGGEPLVETIDDAINTLRDSDLEYLYLPEIDTLIRIKENSRNQAVNQTPE